ncbi:MAG: tetratricopeptide repeat protein [Thermoplasmata archaeon]
MPEKKNIKILQEQIRENKSSVLLISGSEGIGKTHLVMDAFSSNIPKYFKYVSGEDNYTKILDVLDLKEAVTKYLKITTAFSPSQTIKSAELTRIMIMSRLDELKDNASMIFVIDDIDKMDRDFLNIFFNVASKYLKENSKARIIGIYRNDIKNEELQNIIEILKSFGAREIILESYSIEDIHAILEDSGYKIPEKVISIIYELSNGNLKKIFQDIKYLEEKGYIIEKTFIKSVSETTINNIKELFMVKMEEKVLETLNPAETVVTIYLSFLGKKIDPLTLMNIIGMDEYEFVNAVDNLVRKKIVIEDENTIEIRDKEFQRFIENSFSRLKLRDSRLKIAKYLEEKGDIYNAGLQYYYANESTRAYKLLVESANEAYESGDFYKALNAFNIAYKINKNDKEVVKKLIEILTIYDDIDRIIEITEEILKIDPKNVENIINHADALHKKSEFKESKKYYDLALEMGSKGHERARALYGIGRYYYTLEEMEKAKEFLNESLKEARETRDYLTESKALRMLGNVEFQNGNYPRALNYYESSKTINESIGNYYDLAAVYNNIANVSSEINFKEAKYYYYKAQEIAEKYWFPSMLQTLYINIGVMDEYEGKVKEAIYLLKKALGISLINKELEATVISILDLIDPLVKMGDVEEAENYIKIGLEITKKIEKKNEETELIIFKKVLKNIRGENEPYFEELEKIKSSGIKYYTDFAEVSLPSFYFYSGDIKKASELYQKYIDERLQDLNPDTIIDLMDFIEIIVYEKFFIKGFDDNIKYYINHLEKNDAFPFMKFVEWRLNIIKAIDLLESKNIEDAMKLYNENIRQLESQDLKYLSARLKLIFGMYLFKNFEDRKILDKGKGEILNLKLKGVEKAFEKALSL